MKKITVNSARHNTSATFFVPEVIESTAAAMEWLEQEAINEFGQLNRYGKARKRQLEIRRKLCKEVGCRCGIVDEPV